MIRCSTAGGVSYRFRKERMMTLISNYLEERKMQVERQLAIGISWWWVLGPVLWVEMLGRYELVAYADDLTLVAANLGIE